MDYPEPQDLFTANKAWAAQMVDADPEFFSRLSEQQKPRYLWIGCADSRVPANQIVGLPPGAMFVHRNIANMVVPSDLNGLSVLQFAVDVLEVRHVIVAGHYGCGGAKAALLGQRVGLVDNWLRHLEATHRGHAAELDGLDGQDAHDRFCEINVRSQVLNVGRTTVIQDAWNRGQEVSVHGWIYAISNGLLHDLEVDVSNLDDLETATKNYGP